MQLDDFRFHHTLRVRWAEADMQGIVFNGHYLTYADVGITEYFRAMGQTYSGETGVNGSDFFAVRTLLEYRSPARFDELLDVHVRIARLGNSSMQFLIGIYRAEELLVNGEIVYVHADQSSRRPSPIPASFRSAVSEFEKVLPEGA
ncbi:acyl-CoA thioesterase [Halopseudomonas laoshanensis]|jgi:acyl-CoA thioester hydrolase|uniref:Acyl-CoA thioesterase n=1 Tax=Halopseudomonas laoshanensis TaxID=2268758 RepID=A0A7V7GSI7_9GAMM|nr:thioesterase family protein [Halopseudomonas laoshanensis]KAA0693963.1 acyl-CoA thioesterase [Halopseudomonas laoshanensis]WOD11209.1 thioesterase family protein [Pseudomonas sp. NyZ704]